MSVLANSNAIESGGYNIERSLRFRSSASAYLSRTPASAGNRKTWTWSGWVKIGKPPTDLEGIFTADVSVNHDLYLTASNTLRIVWGATNHETTQVFRDYSGWYHIVWVWNTTDATAPNRTQLYINGGLVTAWADSNYPSQNYDGNINTTELHTIARSAFTSSRLFDGYLAEVNFIDGQALTPSSFGQFDAVTGVWQPKKYTGTYGTNGFYLDFKDNTSATTLAQDKSGNGNNWTANNISTTAGATYDSMTDVPTLTSATAANYCVLNSLDKGASVNVSDGNLAYSVPTAASYGGVRGTLAITQKAYWEVTNTCGALPMFIGILSASVNVIGTADLFSVSGQATYRSSNGNKNINGTETAYGASNTTNDVIGVAYDPDTGELTFYKNGTSQGTISTGFTGYTYFPAVYDSTSSVCSAVFNFGQRPFSYTPPTGFKSLNTFNLPDPVIKKPNQYMDATTFAANNSTQSIVNAGGFQPDFVWTKSRSNAYSHDLFDSSRGVNNILYSNATTAETATANSLTSFNSNGFTLGAADNANFGSGNSVAWQWKKGATPGFDIVTYTGTGVAKTVSHSLGVKPSLIIVKNRVTSTINWRVYHSALGATKVIYLSSTSAAATDSTIWNNTEPTSSVFSVGTDEGTSGIAGGEGLVAYLFAEIPGFSKFGSYTGNGSTDGPFVYCGFRPKYVMVKTSTLANQPWYILDSARDIANYSTSAELYPNSSSAEVNSYKEIDLLSNGFKVRSTGTGMNSSGDIYIYAAFAENPFKYSNAR